MTSRITVCLSMLINVALGTATSACQRSEDHAAGEKSQETCEIKAAKAALDEPCVIELSRIEVAKRLPGTTYAKYNARFDRAEQLWVVMAYNEEGPPDSHTSLLVTPAGEIKDFRGGG